MLFLGYDFKNEELLDEALTTPSFRMDYPHVRDNQRLEFLGDAVLGLLSAEHLYSKFAKEPEGALTVRRTRMVSSAALCQAASRLSLAEHLKRNRGAAPLAANAKTLADAIEALIGAAYLDGGYEAARKLFEVLALSSENTSEPWSGNPKGALQERAQAMKPARAPVYTLLETSGVAHAPIFTVKVSVEGMGSAQASERSLKAAESLAATKLLEALS